MKYFIVLFLITYSARSFAKGFKLALIGTHTGKSLSARNTTLSSDGTIVSNSNTQYGLGLDIALNVNWQLLLDYSSMPYQFDNSKNLITGAEKFSLSSIGAGLRYILFSRTALRLMLNSFDDLGLDVRSAQVEIYRESLIQGIIHLDQIVYLGKIIFVGFKVGYGTELSGDKIQNRVSTSYGAFVTYNTGGLGHIESFYELESIKKEDDSLEYVENNSSLSFMYSVKF
jgi:hypothetical protein